MQKIALPKRVLRCVGAPSPYFGPCLSTWAQPSLPRPGPSEGAAVAAAAAAAAAVAAAESAGGAYAFDLATSEDPARLLIQTVSAKLSDSILQGLHT